MIDQQRMYNKGIVENEWQQNFSRAFSCTREKLFDLQFFHYNLFIACPMTVLFLIILFKRWY